MEEPLPSGGSCLLGSINLAEFVTEYETFDFVGFKDTVVWNRLFNFQKDAVISAIIAYKENPKARVVVVSPTGTGKTIIARLLLTNPELHATLIRNPNRKTFRVIYKCHMERLLTQARRRFPDNVVESSLENWMNPDYESDNEIEIVYQMLSKKIDKSN